MKIITIGSATYDILIKYDGAQTTKLQTATGLQSFLLLEEGKKLEVDSVDYKTGGGATNSAVSFVRLGNQVEAFFKIGDDYQGRYIIETLQQEGVGTTYTRKTPHEVSSVSCIVSGVSGDRTILVYRGAARTMQEHELPVKALTACDCIYISSLSGQGIPLLVPITRMGKDHNAVVAINPGSKQLSSATNTVIEALAYTDILLLNSFESALLMYSIRQNSSSTISPESVDRADNDQRPKLFQESLRYKDALFTLKEYVTTLHAYGVNIVVITNGSEGVYVATKNVIYFHPSIPTNVISTLGAGDAFGSTFTAGIVMGKSVEDAIRMGILNSASVITHRDAKTGLLTHTEMDQKLKALDPQLLQKFALF